MLRRMSGDGTEILTQQSFADDCHDRKKSRSILKKTSCPALLLFVTLVAVALVADVFGDTKTLIHRLSPTDERQKHFIFAYGSLIDPESRAITAPSLADAIAQPVKIQNIERVWSARTTYSKSRNLPTEGGTVMGVRTREGASCNGVLIEVDESDLAKFDKREKRYNRKEIDAEDIFEASGIPEHLHDEKHEVLVHGRVKRGEPMVDGTKYNKANIKVWIYMPKDPQPADLQHPIAQSYIDIMLRGCLSISEDFARDFIDTTQGWFNEGRAPQLRSVKRKVKQNVSYSSWVDDRRIETPLYIRADQEYSNRMGEKLDVILRDRIPNALEKRRLLPRARVAKLIGGQ